MADKEEKRYLELQMEELKASVTDNDEQKVSTPKKSSQYNEKNAAIAKLYEDAAEYEEDLKCFEDELVIINDNKLEDIADELTKQLADDERNYPQELKAVLESGLVFAIETQKTHTQEQLDICKEIEFCNVLEALNTQFPQYTGDFEKEIRKILVTRWEMLIAIKKDHIKEEHSEIKTMGLKPKYVQRVYKQFHNLI